MILFHGMHTVTLYTILSVIVLAWYGTGRNPLRAGGVFVSELAANRKFLFHFLAILAIMVINNLELALEQRMNYYADFTGYIEALEHGFVASLQRFFEADWLTYFLSFMYVVIFQAMMLASFAIYAQMRRQGMFYAVCYAIILNYLIAIPFYLFFPVNEVWSHDPNVQFLMLKAFPSFEEEYRALSGLDNCFPSLHTSLSVTLAVIALRSGNRRWAWFCCIAAVLIIFSIFYLGIHWLTDMVGGVALGLFASYAGIRLAQPQSLLLPVGSKASRARQHEA